MKNITEINHTLRQGIPGVRYVQLSAIVKVCLLKEKSNSFWSCTTEYPMLCIEMIILGGIYMHISFFKHTLMQMFINFLQGQILPVIGLWWLS